jgi:formylglycine-generating enzyme required for sulfatase activity
VIDGFIRIPGGSFAMGSVDGQDDEAPIHAVSVDGFEIAIAPVTRAEYGRFVQATNHEPPREWLSPEFRPPDLPVVGVSWHDAIAYCRWRGDARLPTEAEWEWAARGGREGERYPWGDAIPPWIPEGGRGPLQAPWPVTLGDPNGYGLLGIAANVHEWCADWYAAGWYAVSPADDPRGPETGTRRSSRGGSWRHQIKVSRCAARSAIPPHMRYSDYGFRLAADAETDGGAS